MKTILEKSKYIMLIAVIALLTAAIMALVWGVVKTIKAVTMMVTTYWQDPNIALYLIQIVDAFLISIVLYIIAVSVYELFIGDLNLPEWIRATSLHDLKTRLSSVIILVLAIRFLEYVMELKDIQMLLSFAGSITLVSAALIAFSRFGEKEEKH